MADRRRKKNKGEERKIDSEAYELLKSRLEKAPSPDEASAGVLSAEFAHFRGNVPVCSLIEDYLFFSPRKGENHLSAEQILGIFLQYDIVLDKATLSRWSEKPGFEYLLPRLFHEAYGEFGRSEKGGRKNSFTRTIFDDASFSPEYSGAFEWIARETVEKFPNAFFNSDSFRVYARWKGIKGTAEKINLLEDMILRLRKMAGDQEGQGEVPFEWKREWNAAYKAIAEQAVSVMFESRYNSYESKAAMEQDAASVEEAVKKLDQALAEALKIKSSYDIGIMMPPDGHISPAEVQDILNHLADGEESKDILVHLAEGGLSVPNLWRAFVRHYIVPAGQKILEAGRENRGEKLRDTAVQNDMRNKVFGFFLFVNAFLESSGLSPDDEPLLGEIVNALFNAAADKNSFLAGCIVHSAGGDGRGSLLRRVQKTYRERLDRVLEDFLVPGDDIPFSFFYTALEGYKYSVLDTANPNALPYWRMTESQIGRFVLDTTERAVKELEAGRKSEFALSSCAYLAMQGDERPGARSEKYLELLARFSEEWRVVPHIADIAGLAVKHLESARQMGAMLEAVRNTPAAVRNMKESLIRTGSPRFGAPAGEITSILSILAGNPRKGEDGEWTISAQTDPDGTLNEFLRLDSSGTGAAELVREIVSLYASKKILNGEFNRKQENMFSLLAADIFGDPKTFFERLKRTAEHITAVSSDPKAIASVILLPWTEAFLKSGDEVYGKKPSPLSPDGVQWNGIFTAALNRLMNFGNTDEARIALSGILKKIEDVTGKGYTSVPNGVCTELLDRAAQFAPDDPSVLMDVIGAADQIIGALSWREGEAFSDEVKALYGCLNRTVGRLMNLDSSGAYTMECLLSLDEKGAETAKKMCGDHIRDLVSKGVNPLSGGIEYWEKISRIKASVVIRYGDVLKKEVGEEGYGKAVADALRNINGGDAGKDLLGACLSPLAGVQRSSRDKWDAFISSADGQAARIAAGKFSRYSTADEFRRFLDSRDTEKLLNFLEVLDEGGVSRERTDALYKVLSKYRLFFFHKIFSGGLLRMDGENSRDVRVLTRMFTGKPPLEPDSFEALSRAVREVRGTVFGALKELLEEDPRTENIALHQELCRVCFRKVLEEEMPPEEKRASDDYISLMAGLLLEALEAARGEEGESDGKKRRGRGKNLVEPDFPDIL